MMQSVLKPVSKTDFKSGVVYYSLKHISKQFKSSHCPQRSKFHEWHWEGYSTGVIDAHKDSNAAHHACPLPFKLVWLSKMAIQTGVQQTNHS